MTDSEVSANYVAGVVRAYRELGLLTPAVKAKLGPRQREMDVMPFAQRWWPSVEAEAFGAAILELHGPLKLEEAGLRTVLISIGPLLSPLLAVLGALVGLGPHTLLDRFGQLASTSVRWLEFVWKRSGDTSGELFITSPRLDRAVMEPLWRGACRYLFQVSHVQGTFGASRTEGQTLVLALSWKK